MLSAKRKTFVCTGGGGRHKALTLSYDDGFIADERLVEIFNTNGIKATFAINSGYLGDGKRVARESIRELYKGHEVAVHGYLHPSLARCPLSQVIQQIMKDRDELEDAVGYLVRGMTYPYGQFTQEIIELLHACGIEYARVVETTSSFFLPKKIYEWRATCHHFDKLMQHAERFTRLDKKHHLYLMYVWGHSIEYDTADNWKLIQDFSSFMGCRDDIWYVTNIEFVDYMTAARMLKFSVDGTRVLNPSSISVYFEVDGALYEAEPGVTASI